MARGGIIGLLLAGVVIAAPVSAETLREALVKAYQTNPTITGQRAAQRALDENVPIARSAGLPSVNATGGYVNNLFTAPMGARRAPTTASSRPRVRRRGRRS